MVVVLRGRAARVWKKYLSPGSGSYSAAAAVDTVNLRTIVESRLQGDFGEDMSRRIDDVRLYVMLKAICNCGQTLFRADWQISSARRVCIWLWLVLTGMKAPLSTLVSLRANKAIHMHR